jgi:glutathione S-transferase
MGEYSLADIAHTGNFHRLRQLAKSGEVSLEKFPSVVAWMERVESRESYKASI